MHVKEPFRKFCQHWNIHNWPMTFLCYRQKNPLSFCDIRTAILYFQLTRNEQINIRSPIIIFLLSYLSRCEKSNMGVFVICTTLVKCVSFLYIGRHFEVSFQPNQSANLVEHKHTSLRKPKEDTGMKGDWERNISILPYRPYIYYRRYTMWRGAKLFLRISPIFVVSFLQSHYLTEWTKR